jgi:hypothetical protein
MDDVLPNIVGLINISSIAPEDGVYSLEFIPNEGQKQLIIKLKASNAVDEITQNGKVIDAGEIVTGSALKIALVQFELQQFRYYEDIDALINANEFSVPGTFYVRGLQYLHPTGTANSMLQAYFAIVELAECITALALFKADDNGRTIYLMQDKSAVALPLIYDKSVLERAYPDLNHIKSFVTEIEGHSERKKIYVKELIDFLNEEKVESLRFEHLFKNFNDFYQKCEAAYAFFLSDFSYSKLKLELESAILDYSKNIRAIINDSQTKLIAIPAAFIVASSQLELNKSVSLKNILIIISSFVFSVLIEIFIRNQESSLKIFIDNVASYKMTFKLKNEGIEVKAMQTLQGIIAKSFRAIDDELQNQQNRLRYIRYINWGMSVFLVFIVAGLFFYFKTATSLSVIFISLVFFLFHHC